MPSADSRYQWLNRLTWGANSSLLEHNAHARFEDYLTQQLHPTPTRLPDAVEDQLQTMSINQKPVEQWVYELEQQRKDANALTDDSAKKEALRSYQNTMNQLAKEAASRHVLRALYSPNQIQEQMVWFWLNHFSVYQNKGNIRALIGDYEEHAIRPHALGQFKDLLAAVVHHPAMLRYLDNEQNAVGRINENYARELMELHTLGVNAGYSQNDVQELARVLTGVGIHRGADAEMPRMKHELQGFYVRKGLFEFNPARHDFGDKQLLGTPLKAKGLAEVDEALLRLSRHPATARFISRKLAQFWLADAPPAALVKRMEQAFIRSDGNIAQTLRTLLDSPEYAQATGQQFKDPMRYVISATRLTYDTQPIVNVTPVLNWLSRLGEPLYGRQTPDGFPLHESAWASPGQMVTRFEIAKAIGSGNARLFHAEGSDVRERATVPPLAQSLSVQSLKKTLSPATRQALEQASSAQEWNSLLLSSPEMMAH